MRDQCGGCRHWRQVDAVDGRDVPLPLIAADRIGLCTARPPMPVLAQIEQTPGTFNVTYQSMYPQMRSDFPACGEFHQRRGQEPDLN